MKKTWILLLLLFAFPCVAEECDFLKLNVCFSCDDPHVFVVGSNEACSFLCPGRVINFEGSGSGMTQINCALEKCPSEYPFQSKYGSCYKTQKEAENDYGDFEEKFNFDNSTVIYNESEIESTKKDCPKENQFKRWDEKCFSCNYPKAVRVETHCNLEETCDDICPNRTIIKSIGGNVPSVPNCPTEKPMMDDEGICYSCDTPIAIGVRWNPDFCHRFCPNKRHLKNGVSCVLNEKDYESSQPVITDPTVFQPKEERFVNPLFYKRLSCISKNYETYLTPNKIISTAHEPFDNIPCYLLKNSDKTVILSCTLKEKEPQTFIFKYVLTDRFHYEGCRVVEEYSRFPNEKKWTGYTGFCLHTDEAKF